MESHNECADILPASNSARGSLRDGLAALQNFENLLKSPRIGPRPLAQLLVGLRSSCVSIENALVTVIDEIAERASDDEVLRSLKEFALARVRKLDASLQHAARVGMGARVRLSLEADVHSISAELGAVRGLIELLDAATHSVASELDLSGLVMESVDALAVTGKKTPHAVHVTARLPNACPTVVTDPHVVIRLIALAIGLLASTQTDSIEIVAVSSDESGVDLLVRACPKVDHATACTAPFIIAPSVDVAAFAARLLGANLRYDAAEKRASIALQPV